MPSIYQLKPIFQNVLRPLVKKLYQLGVTANQVTLSAMIISVLLGLFLYLQAATSPLIWLLFPVWMLLRMAFNAVDGMLAREFNQQSKLGAFYNELSDVISDSALYLSFLCIAWLSAELLLLMCFLAILSEYAGVMAPLVGAERRYDGPMGKSDRAFCLSLLAILIYLSSLLPDLHQRMAYLANGLIILIILLLLLTTFNRIKKSINLP
ncbi:CDP-alcohol phosphatidyltransferase family protein [Acinetobacter pullicarnis]|uniref:CDP-alcohol phosphatidyltransferase family protein n=1 Tax=Acinetobacter pullicarnis TaxID=2576829 RepID=UPI001120CD29|nr:CDP-alcohol phosphatidyltransferase family protein [Acinetobacter pullicarnis]